MEQLELFLHSVGALGVVGTIIIGALAGFAATLIMPGDDPSGLLLTPLLGIAGSSLATYLGHYLNVSITGELSGFVAAVVGAILILLVYRIIFRRTG